MFAEIIPLLEKVHAITFTVSKNGEKLVMNVLPMCKEGEEVLPLSITATAEELDAGLAQVLLSYREETESMIDQSARIKAEMEADKAAKAEAAKANTAKPAVSKPSTKPASSSAKPATPAKPTVAAPSMDELF